MSYQFYWLMHLLGIFMILLPLGGIALHMINGGTRNYPARKWMAIMHGVGLVLVLVAGFGLLARLGMARSMPMWSYAKMVIWLSLGIMPLFLYRQAKMARILLLTTLVLAFTAAALALYKPGMGLKSAAVTESTQKQ